MQMQRMLMHSDMVYEFPIWQIGALLMAAAACGAMLIEIVTRRFLSVEFRRRHNDVTGSIFSIIGVTYAVLLAFVATLAWDGYNKAKAASYAEAGAALDIYTISEGFPDTERLALRDNLVAYLRAVVEIEWPARALGRTIEGGLTDLATLNRTTFTLKPQSGADSAVRTVLLQSVMRLSDARHERLLAMESSIPGVVWVVTVLGGALTVAFSSFLGTASLRLHLAMVAFLTMSGALILIMIIALSNPSRGDFRVSTEPFDHALAQISH